METDKWHWLNSYLHSLQKVPDAYPVSQFNNLDFPSDMGAEDPPIIILLPQKHTVINLHS